MIWVIGCKGMLGTEVCRQLEKNKLAWIGSGKEIDITKYEALENFITTKETELYRTFHNYPEKDPDLGKIKWIINCAAYTAVDKAESEPELAEALNTKGPRNISRAARNHGAKLIHISTDYVFDGHATSPIAEKAVKNPCGVYGKTKSDGEDEIISSMTQYYILRTAWLYGFDGNNFVYTMIKLFNSRSSIQVVSDQRGTPTFCGDLADTIVKMILKSQKASSFFGKNSAPSFGIYNFTNQGETTWHEFAMKIHEIAKKAGRLTQDCEIEPCTTQEFGAKAPRPAYSVLDKSKIEKELKIKIPGWQTSLEYFIKNKNFRSE